MSRRFVVRVLLSFAGLMALVQAAALVAVLDTGERVVAESAAGSLQVGAAVLRADLEAGEQRLLDRADALERDPALLAALTRGGQKAREAVLREHADRSGAGLALLFTPDAALAAASQGGAGVSVGLALRALLDAAREAGDARGVVVYDGIPHQLVLRALPRAAGWIAVGRPLGDAVAEALREKRQIQVSLWAERSDTGPS